MRRSRSNDGLSALEREWFNSCFKRGNISKVISLLDDHGINIHTRDKDGNSALMIAVLRGNQPLVDVLLARNIDIHCRNESGDTALSIACDNSKVVMVKLLLNHEQCNENLVNLEHTNGKSPLHIVCENGNAQLVKLLICNEFADIDAQDNDGLTPLHILIEQNNAELVESITEHGCNVNIMDNEGNSPLLIACMRNRRKIFNLLVQNHADISSINSNSINCLISAAMHNSMDVFADLIELIRSSDPRQFDHQDCCGDTALIVACKKGYVGVIKMLLACPLNVDIQNMNGDTAFMCLCNKSTKDMESIELFVRKADVNVVNNDGYSVLVMAAKQNDFALMKLLVEQGGANVNACNKEKDNALCVACERENSKIVEYLMVNGADPNLQNATGFTGLIHACQRNETKVAKLLLSHNANPNLRNFAGYTALVWASINQNTELVTELLRHNADPNVSVLTNSRYTALTWAMIKNNIDVIKQLLYHGADPHLPVNNGKTSFDYLNNSQKVEIFSYYDRVHRWYRRKSLLMFLVYCNYLPLKKNSQVVYQPALKYERIFNNIHLVQIISTYL